MFLFPKITILEISMIKARFYYLILVTAKNVFIKNDLQIKANVNSTDN